jgi:hypothetical integral membrane protein (TIGR02206 family)
MMGAHWHVFVSYSALHFGTLAVCALLIAAVALFGRRLRGSEAELGLRRTLAYFGLGFWVFYNVLWNWNGRDLYDALPLHLCDLNGLIGPLALITGHRWLRATLYFWTLVLGLQAFIQPALVEGPAFLVFWAFWLSHTITFACAIYDLAVLGFRPGWRDLGRASVVSLAYLALIIPIDLWLEANYGFVGHPPPHRSLPPMVGALGPWPQRVLLMAGLAFAGFLIALAPWLVWGGRREGKREDVSAGGRMV